MEITQKFAKHFEEVARAHEAEDWAMLSNLQKVEREMIDAATPEEQYEYYLRVAHDHTGVALEKIDRAVAAMCLSDDVGVKTDHITQHILNRVEKLIAKSEKAVQKLDGFLEDLKGMFEQDIAPLPKGHIARAFPLEQ